MQNRRKSDKGPGMRQVVAVALALLLLLFLMPLLFFRGERSFAEPEVTPSPTATLPIGHTVVSPSPTGEKEDKDRMVRVKLADGTVREMSMADYLWRVVAAEMPASFHLEALKAQAVAARTYTVAKMASPVENHPDADVCTDINCCQAYIEPEAAALAWGNDAQSYTDKVTQAVTETDALVATYGGAPIQAVFFSSTAGRTVDAVEVWGNAVPYLTGVVSPEGEEVPNYHSTMSLSLDGFKSIFLSQYPEANLDSDSAGWFTNIAPNSAGGVEQMDIGGVTVSGGALRTLFGLRSTNFTVAAANGSVTFQVTGYGHGVGMSQYGANALAEAGKTCEEIIKWYYTGVELERSAN
ncbi:Stage II sporulation protein D [uncultured Eubacteriales bacterium]|uniref:Stage II sporulation protein D n=1 Tax=uncultured Eubacteriales bacterium TaxID=172733 RepID=A0A212IWJ0_9FIRM|nr:Stage II sporulation protein D [uncultured Eubacteriales bacterium]